MSEQSARLSDVKEKAYGRYCSSQAYHFLRQSAGCRFSLFSVYKARLLGLAGWVKNLDDGSVEMEVQGKKAEIDTLIQFLDGHRWIRIDAMDVENIAVIPDHDFVER